MYDRISSHFSRTRFSKWSCVREFLDTIPASSIVLDLGCGNGKYLDYFNKEKKVAMIGCDRCEELLKICRDRAYEVALVDGSFHIVLIRLILLFVLLFCIIFPQIVYEDVSFYHLSVCCDRVDKH